MGNGMTDVFAVEKFKELFLPMNWTVKWKPAHFYRNVPMGASGPT